jgi:hypothetical protein
VSKAILQQRVAFVSISSTGLPKYTGPLAYRVNEVAAATGLCRSQVYNLMRNGTLPFIEVGKIRLVILGPMISVDSSDLRSAGDSWAAQRKRHHPAGMVAF